MPGSEQAAWASAPLAGVAQHLAAPGWVRTLLAIALVCAALLMLAPATHAALADAEHLLEGLAAQGTLPEGLTTLHSRFGTPARALDVVAAASILVVLSGSGRVQWLGRAYAIAVAATVVLKVATLIRLRQKRLEPEPFKVPANVQLAGRELSVGLIMSGLLVAASAIAMIARGDGPSIVTAALLGGLTVLLFVARRDAEPRVAADNPATLDLLPAAELSLDHIDARPATCWSRCGTRARSRTCRPRSGASADRDVVVMTVRLIGLDVAEDAADRRRADAGRAAAALGGDCASPSGTAARSAC